VALSKHAFGSGCFCIYAPSAKAFFPTVFGSVLNFCNNGSLFYVTPDYHHGQHRSPQGWLGCLLLLLAAAAAQTSSTRAFSQKQFHSFAFVIFARARGLQQIHL